MLFKFKNYAFLLAFFIFYQNYAQEKTKLQVKNRTDHISFLAREPMVCQHKDGSLYVTGYRNDSESPQLWKSIDFGKTGKSVFIGTKKQGAIGNSDVDLFIDNKGNIYLLSMSFTKFPKNLEGFDFSSLKGSEINLGISRDLGKTWTWQNISKKDYDDRPWLTQTTDNNLHIIWNDGNGIHHKLSKDFGKTWIIQKDISEKGGSSFLASGYNNQLAVRVAPLSASGFKIDNDFDYIQLSLDNGKSWKKVNIPGKRTWNKNFLGIPRWVEPIVFDKEDNLYTLWSEGTSLKLAKSSNNGKTWKEKTIVKSKDTLYYPYLKMSKRGLLCTWVSGFKDNIKHNAAFIENNTTFFLKPQKLELFSRFDIGAYTLATGGEYYPIMELNNGNFGMVTTIQNSRAKRNGFTWWELELSK